MSQNKTTRIWKAIGKGYQRRKEQELSLDDDDNEVDDLGLDAKHLMKFVDMFEKEKLGDDEDYFDINGSNNVTIEKSYEKQPKDYEEIGDEVWKLKANLQFQSVSMMKPEDAEDRDEKSLISRSESIDSSISQTSWKNEPFMLIGLHHYPQLQAGLVHSNIYNKRRFKGASSRQIPITELKEKQQKREINHAEISSNNNTNDEIVFSDDISESIHTINTSLSSEIHNRAVNSYLSMIEMDNIDNEITDLGNNKGIAMLDEEVDSDMEETAQNDDKSIHSAQSFISADQSTKSAPSVQTIHSGTSKLNKVVKNIDNTTKSEAVVDEGNNFKEEPLVLNKGITINVEENIEPIENHIIFSDSFPSDLDAGLLMSEITQSVAAIVLGSNETSVIAPPLLPIETSQSDDQDDFISTRSMEIIKNELELIPPDSKFIDQEDIKEVNQEEEAEQPDVTPKVISQIEKVSRSTNSFKKIYFDDIETNYIDSIIPDSITPVVNLPIISRENNKLKVKR